MITGPVPVSPQDTPKPRRSHQSARPLRAALKQILVPGDDDEDLPTAQVQVAGATVDPVKDYLEQIGKTPLLNAEQEVELAKRIKAGLSAEEKLADGERVSDARRA